MISAICFLAQMDPNKLLNDGTPPLSSDASFGMTWVVIALLSAGILAITFKTSKRNHLERE